jgi:hypothetical protein
MNSSYRAGGVVDGILKAYLLFEIRLNDIPVDQVMLAVQESPDVAGRNSAAFH